MALRWYTTVVQAHDVAVLGRWWAETLGWRIVYEAPDELVLVPGWVTEADVAATPWERVGPGLVFVPAGGDKPGPNRLHLDLAPHVSDDRDAEIERLVARGARRVDVGQPTDVSWTVLADPEGNEFCVLSSRES
ncbi:VOC family protein [Nocardioides zeae]|uniref:VOC family protein n=1 Tax=Nocardioides imazamoxiresistens TaxID=3231893 RepID=A0ABU3PX09_9ACTN|nr:VOC family protein [Nocardioides zeae]MDT9593773.1 VOC family protein [Nocardioides zeae]